MKWPWQGFRSFLGLLTSFWQLTWPDMVPFAVRAVLGNRLLFAKVLTVVLEVARFSNLNAEQRRTEAVFRAQNYLKAAGVELSTQELNLLIELVYGLAKRRFPQALAPLPAAWGSANHRQREEEKSLGNR